MERANYMKAESWLFIFMCAISLSVILFPLVSNAEIPPKISVNTTSINLGSVKLDGVSTPYTLTIKNTGISDLIVNSITIAGTNATEFSQTNDCTTIPQGSSCTVNVTLTPTLPFGSKNSIMTILSNDPKKPTVNVKILGQAPPPKIAVTPTSVKIGSIPVSDISSPKVVTVKNTGISDLVVNSITIAGTNATEFSQTNDCTTLSQGTSCAIAVTLNPTSAGSKSAIMSISSDDPKKPIINVTLSGSGTGGTGQSYSKADLAGTWEMNDLASGDPWWGRATWAIGSDGSVTFTNAVSSDGSAFLPSTPVTLIITNDGIITVADFTSLQCAMDSGKSIMACTSTSPHGNTDMIILTKKAASYSKADLVGTWETNGLLCPGPWWQRGAVTIGSDGSFTGMFEGSDGSSKSLSGIFSITADGIITATGSNPNPSHRCVMDSGKSIVVCTNSNDSGSTTEMHIFVKKD